MLETFNKYFDNLDDEFKTLFLSKTVELEKSISEGLDKLSNKNPLNDVFINIKEIGEEPKGKYYISIYEVKMINLL